MDWMSVHGWVAAGGADLGTNRKVPEGSEPRGTRRADRPVPRLGAARHRRLGGIRGGVPDAHRAQRPSGLPDPRDLSAGGDRQHLPGSDLSIGADTALNAIVDAVDRIKQSAVAWRRCFVVEVMGRYCGYLAVMSGLATGAERVYTHEEGLTMAALQEDLAHLVEGFRSGKRLGLMIRNEKANPVFSTDFLRTLFDEEGKGLFDARQAILAICSREEPDPFDRIQATRLAVHCVEFLVAEAGKAEPAASFIGVQGGACRHTTSPPFRPWSTPSTAARRTPGGAPSSRSPGPRPARAVFLLTPATPSRGRCGRVRCVVRLRRRPEDQCRQLGLDQILELGAELGQGHAGRRGELRQLVRVFEVVAPQAEHVAPRDGVARGVDVHHPDLRPAVSGSIRSLKGMGTKFPPCIEIMTAFPPERRYFVEQ